MHSHPTTIGAHKKEELAIASTLCSIILLYRSRHGLLRRDVVDPLDGCCATLSGFVNHVLILSSFFNPPSTNFK
jgi:hypothetical protein